MINCTCKPQAYFEKALCDLHFALHGPIFFRERGRNIAGLSGQNARRGYTPGISRLIEERRNYALQAH